MSPVLLMKSEPRKDIELSIDEIAKEGPRHLLVKAHNFEIKDYKERFKAEVNENGRRRVVRNGVIREHKISMASGTVAVQARESTIVAKAKSPSHRFFRPIFAKLAKLNP